MKNVILKDFKNNSKKTLLGNTASGLKKRGRKPNKKYLLGPLPTEDSVIFNFCKKCGRYYGNTKVGAKIHAEMAGVVLPSVEKLKKYFFQQEGCVVCSRYDGGGWEKILFRSIGELI